MNDIRQLRTELKSWIKKEKPLLVLVFGSSVTGIPGPKPDLDIAVLFGREPDSFNQYSGISRSLDRFEKVDVMFLDTADPIARLAACDGKLIYEDAPGRFDRFASLAARQFMDNQKLNRIRRELTDEFLKERGYA